MSISIGTEPELWIAVDSRVTYGRGEISCECVEMVLSRFHCSDKKYGRGGKTFQPVFVFYPFAD
jgi:hypothetical protein